MIIAPMMLCSLQTKRHIRRQADDVVFQREVLRVDDITGSNALVKLFLEPLQRSGRIILRRLRLDGENPVFQFAII